MRYVYPKEPLWISWPIPQTISGLSRMPLAWCNK
jgi:hypothetical protein